MLVTKWCCYQISRCWWQLNRPPTSKDAKNLTVVTISTLVTNIDHWCYQLQKPILMHHRQWFIALRCFHIKEGLSMDLCWPSVYRVANQYIICCVVILLMPWKMHEVGNLQLRLMALKEISTLQTMFMWFRSAHRLQQTVYMHIICSIWYVSYALKWNADSESVLTQILF